MNALPKIGITFYKALPDQEVHQILTESPVHVGNFLFFIHIMYYLYYLNIIAYIILLLQPWRAQRGELFPGDQCPSCFLWYLARAARRKF